MNLHLVMNDGLTSQDLELVALFRQNSQVTRETVMRLLAMRAEKEKESRQVGRRASLKIVSSTKVSS